MAIIPVLWFVTHARPLARATPLCDGINDDTAALQAIIDSTGSLRIPSNRTCLSQPLLLRSNFKLTIETGGILKAGKKWRDGRPFLSAYNCTNITIFGIPGGGGGTIDGSGMQWWVSFKNRPKHKTQP